MTTTLQLTSRSRHDLREIAETIRLQAWFVQEAIDNDAVDADEAIKRLGLVISKAKDLDRKIKARRRQALKAVAS